MAQIVALGTKVCKSYTFISSYM